MERLARDAHRFETLHFSSRATQVDLTLIPVSLWPDPTMASRDFPGLRPEWRKAARVLAIRAHASTSQRRQFGVK